MSAVAWASRDELEPARVLGLGGKKALQAEKGRHTRRGARGGPSQACKDARAGRAFSDVLQTDLRHDFKKSQPLGSS